MPPPTASGLNPPPSLAAFALLMARVGLTSFGGGISGWMLRIVAHDRRWMTEAEFLDGYSLCQVVPGITVVNLSIWLGARLHGGRGALIGAVMMVIPPGLLMLAILGAFTALAHDPLVHDTLDGVTAAAIGLTGAMSLRAARRCTRLIPAVLMGATFLAVGVLQWPLLPVMAALIPLSIALAWIGTT